MIAELCMALLLGVNVGTYHFENQSEHNNINPGMYLSCSLTQKSSIVFGAYKNSQSNQSVHFGWNYDIMSNDKHSLNITFGGVTGYSAGPLIPVVLPAYVYKFDNGLKARLSFIPPLPRVDGGIHLSFERNF